MGSLVRIQMLVREGRYRDALSACDSTLEQSPDDVDVLIEKAQILALPLPDLRRPTEAADLLRRAISREPGVPELHLALGFVYDLGESDYGGAVREYRECLRLAPDHAKCHLAIARLYQAPGAGLSLEEALKHARHAVTGASGDWEPRRELAKLSWLSGDLPESLRQFRAALAAQPPPDERSAVQIRAWIAALEKGQPYTVGYLQGNVRSKA